MDIQRLRNLTTHRLHTQMGHIYEDIEYLTGFKGLMTHQIPNASRALDPWLKEKVGDARFWDGAYDPSHVGEFSIQPMTVAESSAMMKRFSEMRSPLDRA